MKLGWELLLFDSSQTCSFSWCSSPSQMSMFPIPVSLRSCLALWSFMGPSQPQEPAPCLTCSGLIIFPSADLFHRSVTSDLCQHFPSRTLGEEDSPIRNTLIVPNWELLEQIRYSSINLPFLSPFNICCLNTVPWGSWSILSHAVENLLPYQSNV